MEKLVKKNKSSKKRGKRYYLLDAVRGLCILGMILYHTLFDFVAFFGVNVSPSLIFAVDVIRDFGAACFICLSGICIHFGKKPLKRASLITAFGIVVSLVTFFVVPDMPIVFGILTFMGLASFIIMPLKKLFDKLPPWPFAILSLFLFLVFFECTDGYIGYYGFRLFDLPSFLYRNYATALLGFPFEGFLSSDYFPVLPWIFMFFFGFFLWNALSGFRIIKKLLSIRITVLEKIGKYSLYIYVAHQPVIMGLIYAVYFVLYLIVKHN